MLKSWCNQEIEMIFFYRKLETKHEMAKVIDPKFTNLLKELECAICFRDVNDARLCPHCSKFFCEKCINAWLNTSGDCPSCRTPVERGSLMKGRSIDSIMELINELLAGKDHCSKHANQQLNMFCNACMDIICVKCFFSQEHAKHKGYVLQLDDGFETHRNKLKTAIDGINERQEYIQNILSKLQEEERRFTEHMELIKDIQKESKALIAARANPAAMKKMVEIERLIKELPDEPKRQWTHSVRWNFWRLFLTNLLRTLACFVFFVSFFILVVRYFIHPL